MSRKRTREPERKQGVFRYEIPEDSIPATHRARVLWALTEKLDLSRFLAKSKAVEGGVGRSSLSPRMKLTLWLYAVAEGIGSARKIARLTRTEDGFRWIVGNLSVHHDTLSAFRAQQGEAFDALMTDVLAALVHKGVLSLELVAQDGMRVRACAASSSFRSHGSLLECRQQAALHVKAVLAQSDDEDQTAAEHAHRLAAARDFERRVEDAITTVQELQKSRRPSDREARASTTDAEARVMKMADGGFRPAYNVQLATAGSALGGPRTIVGVRVTNQGSDMSAIEPMLDDIERRTGMLPKVILADANHGHHAGIRAAAARGVNALIPVPEHSRMPGDKAAHDEAIVAWRARMETDETKQLYRARAGLCELTNAHMRRHHGIDYFLVRGLTKVTSVVLLAAIASNLIQHAATLLS